LTRSNLAAGFYPGKLTQGGIVGYVDIRFTKEEAVIVQAMLEESPRREIQLIAHGIHIQLSAMWDAKHDQEAPCFCGHSYYRHFDSYEDMEPVGCKYCECMSFEE
jgi:hypothetical protein